MYTLSSLVKVVNPVRSSFDLLRKRFNQMDELGSGKRWNNWEGNT